MSSIESITFPQSQELKKLGENFDYKTKLAGCSSAAATFLLIGALIVITCGCLCLMLPGVNVISHVILRAVVPGSLAIVVSIPFILLTVRHRCDQDFFRKRLITRMVSLLEEYKVPEKKLKAERVDFILKNFLNLTD